MYQHPYTKNHPNPFTLTNEEGSGDFFYLCLLNTIIESYIIANNQYDDYTISTILELSYYLLQYELIP